MRGLGLAGLAEIQPILKRRRDEVERAARERAEQLAALDRERRRFELSVGPVTRMKDQRLAVLRREAPRPEPKQSAADEADVLRQALSDGFDVESLLETDEELSYRRPGVSTNVLHRLRRGHWSLQAQLDLHGLRQDEAREAIGHFFHLCQAQERRCVRIIHGKGHGSPGREGILRVKVRRWLVQHDAVLAFVQARADEGGAGALVVLLA
ncbi:Smr/MutS family protein [Inhella gelatinilytica]|uniref:Smr/MutS family protein n=1 Tax=Inhella gelatinilytica TaxID=2795030 RepID=A0A931IYN1_9BURK|nr:Smr/MutS family protein [Inhella gelatinilytica]MBH9553410.1 Smr/MutS family protein [Inhella gelatinilytica]